MSTETKEISLAELAAEVAQLRQEVEVYHRTAIKLDHAVEEFKNSNSSRRGLAGSTGAVGPAGRDAVVRIIQADGKVQVVDLEGKVHAELVAVPGPAGKGAVAPPPARDGRDGAPGKPGKDAPSIAEIVKAVIAEVKTKL
jgi:hypothetical protein